MSARDVLKNLNAFVNGIGYAGQVDEYNPPKQTLKLEEFMGGGMFAPAEITMAMEKMEADLSILAYDALILSDFSIAEGNNTSLTVRGHLESFDGTKSGVVHILRGKIKELDRGSWKPGEKALLKLSMAVTYFKETRDGVVIHEIDPANMKYVVGGIDVLAIARANLGI
jgi:hypothetical protein